MYYLFGREWLSVAVILLIVIGALVDRWLYRRRRAHDTLREYDDLALALLERYYFDNGEFRFECKSGTKSTKLRFTHRVKGEVSDGDHPEELLIWIPTKDVAGMIRKLEGRS